MRKMEGCVFATEGWHRKYDFFFGEGRPANTLSQLPWGGGATGGWVLRKEPPKETKNWKHQKRRQTQRAAKSRSVTKARKSPGGCPARRRFRSIPGRLIPLKMIYIEKNIMSAVKKLCLGIHTHTHTCQHQTN